MFRQLLLHFRSNSAETWPSKVVPFIQALTMFIWLIGPPEGPLSDAKRTEFAISDMIVIALTTKFWEEYKLFLLVVTRGIVLKLMTRFSFRVYFWGFYTHKIAWVLIFFHYFLQFSVTCWRLKVGMQVRNQEFFRAGEVSENKGTLINIFNLQHTKENPRREKFRILFS